MGDFQIEPITESQRDLAAQLIVQEFGSARMVTRGRLLEPAQMPGYIAWSGEEPIGLATYEIVGDAWEIAVVLSRREGIGVGSALIEAIRKEAEQRECRRLWLITTNDNTHALRFYPRRGFHIAAIHCNALEASRRLKPEIPLIGNDGIPLRDEIELEILLAPATEAA